MLTIEYRTDPGAVAELLPPPLSPATEDPGAVAVVWADWQSCSDGFDELLDPVRAQYKECFVVVRCRYRAQTFSRCVYIWVDKDFAMVRGHVQGYPKKLGEIWLTRPVTVGRAGPRLEPGGRFGATCSAGGRRLIEASFEISGPSDGAGFVNALPMLHHRFLPAIESDGTDSLHELVTMRGYDTELGPAFGGEANARCLRFPHRGTHPPGAAGDDRRLLAQRGDVLERRYDAGAHAPMTRGTIGPGICPPARRPGGCLTNR